jgi:hypothetical protein
MPGNVAGGHKNRDIRLNPDKHDWTLGMAGTAAELGQTHVRAPWPAEILDPWLPDE